VDQDDLNSLMNRLDSGRHTPRAKLADPDVEAWWRDLAQVPLDSLVHVARAAGHRGWTVPMGDIAVSRLLKHAHGRPPVEQEALRLVVVAPDVDGDGRVRVPELAPPGCAVLVLGQSPRMFESRSLNEGGQGTRSTWQRLQIEGPGMAPGLSPERVASVRRVWQLLTLAQLLGAAARCHELAIAHARTRVAFGQPIGAYQAVSHRAANASVHIQGADALIREAWGTALDVSKPTMASELAVRHTMRVLPDIVHMSGETLGAVGYFEEHEFPALFRTVHAGLARIRPSLASDTQVFAQLVQSAGAGLPTLEEGEEALRFRAEVADFASRHELARDAVVHLDNIEDRSNDQIAAEAASLGYLTLGWPVEYGGADAPFAHQLALAEELTYRRVPLGARVDSDLVGTAIFKHGGEAQREHFLPIIASGQLNYYTAYSELEFGSDLAQVQTRASREGDDWVIHGRKAWGTRAQNAEYAWLLARTSDNEDAPHRGLTMFLAPCRGVDGWRFDEHVGLNGEISCTTYFDGMRVPDLYRIGDVDQGWRVLMSSLAKIRIFMANSAASMNRHLDDVLVELRRRGSEMADRTDGGAAARALEIAAKIQVARILVRATSSASDAKLAPAVAKLVACEVYRDLSEWAFELFGWESVLTEGQEGAVLGGSVEYNLRYTLMQTLAGGTPDIQRNQIARMLALG